MSQNTRKLIGTVVLVILVVFYAMIATTVAVARLAESPGWVHFLYFLLTGVLWVVPAMFVIKWMLRPDKV